MIISNVDAGSIYKVLKHKSFYFKYEPIYNVCEKKIAAYEALLRVNINDENLRSPDNFIAIAEVFFPDLVNDVLYTVFKKSAIYFRQKIHFNLSINNLKFLDKTDIKENIVYEITEEVLSSLENFKYIKKKADEGFKFAIDDFGRGYNSFSNILNQEVKYEYVKFDKELIMNLREKRVQNTLRSLRCIFEKDIGCTVLVEGVEKKWEYDVLRELGFCFMQGWYFRDVEDDDFADESYLL